MTEISLSAQLAITLGSALVGAGAAWGMMKASLAAVAKEASAGAAQAAQAMKALEDFKLEAAKNYVSTAALLRLEGRLDEGFKALRDEMRDQNTLIINALSARPAPRSRPREE